MLGVFGQPTFPRRPFAVLFVVAVLRHDVFGGQGDDLGASWAHDHRGDGRVIREGLAIGALTGETVWAMHGLGRKVLGAIQRHQPLVAKAPKARERAMLFQTLTNRHKHGIKEARGKRIEQVADLIVTGNLLHAQQGVGVSVALGVLQPALGVQK